MGKIIEEVKGLYKITQFESFRKTPGVTFDMVPVKMFKSIDSIDRVLHDQRAISPIAIGDVKRPWYMHEFQEDNLLVLSGSRSIDIYTPEHGVVENFVITPNKLYKNGKLVIVGSVILTWSQKVFHRIISGDKGSASINIAVHYEGYDIRNNFDIYDLDIATGKYKVIREGFKDQI